MHINIYIYMHIHTHSLHRCKCCLYCGGVEVVDVRKDRLIMFVPIMCSKRTWHLQRPPSKRAGAFSVSRDLLVICWYFENSMLL